MVATYIFGILIITQSVSYYMSSGWLHAKLTLVLILSATHGYFAKLVKDFAQDNNQHTEKFYRIINEVPTILMIAIVILVVVKPF
jgi:putative membrane protein